MTMQPQAVTAADMTAPAPLGQALLELNNAHATELSWLEPERLRHLVDEAFLAWRIGDAEAMLLVFDQSADYDSVNFQWFRRRFERFLYVDRVVVAPRARGRGHARRLYAGLFRQAALAGHSRIGCEVNIDPPNRPSDAFHASLGFVERGTAVHRGAGKTVRYLTRDVLAHEAGPRDT